jgi:FtsP/CotA-like multicopper oxidase with cupredoxin domain
MSESIRKSTMRFSLAAALLSFLLVPMTVSAQTLAPAYVDPGEVRVDDEKGTVILMNDADRNVPAPVGKQHLRFYQGWTLKNPEKKYPADPTLFGPGPTMRAAVGSKVSILFMNTINDKNFSYTTVTAKNSPNPQAGCDQASNPALYPAKDVFPNCFHGSSTANIHFHGTHTNPDGLGDNVLVQVMPDTTTPQSVWIKYFNEVMAKATIPATWAQMPADYKATQQTLVKARGNGLWKSDEQQIGLGQWPQYIAGGYVNTFPLPAYTKGGPYKAAQAPGTMWYHAHKHGSTALHSLQGLAGAFIIEGAYDQFFKDFYKTNWKPGSEKVMVFQMINSSPNLARGGVNFASLGPGLLLLNGLANPVLTMRPGEVQLWRIVNATPGSVFKGQAVLAGPGVLFPDLFCVGTPAPACQTAGFQIAQTAKDGVQFSPTNYKNQPFMTGLIPNQYLAPKGLILAGGNRADVLVKAPSTPTTTPIQFTTNGGPAFQVTVTGTPVTGMNLPAATDWPAMPEYLQDLSQPTDYPHQVTFGWDAEPGRAQVGGGRLTSNVGLNLPPHYTIDNKQFEQFGPLIDQCVPLNGLQEWVLVNETTVTHPFHIHINPFQITKVEAPQISADGNSFTYQTYAPADNFVWNDVVGIPAGVVLANGQFAPGKVTIRQQFVDFTGTYVLHCHILAHEDRGMMQLVRVVPANQYPAQCQQAIPHHH